MDLQKLIDSLNPRKRATASAMREMRHSGYVADWHDQLIKRTDWNRF